MPKKLKYDSHDLNKRNFIKTDFLDKINNQLDNRVPGKHSQSPKTVKPQTSLCKKNKPLFLVTKDEKISLSMPKRRLNKKIALNITKATQDNKLKKKRGPRLPNLRQRLNKYKNADSSFKDITKDNLCATADIIIVTDKNEVIGVEMQRTSDCNLLERIDTYHSGLKWTYMKDSNFIKAVHVVAICLENIPDY